jgi:hypothetical protein
VADGVAIVEYGAQVALALVLGDHGGFESYGVQDQGLQCCLVADSGGGELTEVLEELAAGKEPHLQNFGEAVRELAGGQCFKPIEIRRYEAGLQEGADEVLTLREVQAYFASDRAVHHREQ